MNKKIKHTRVDMMYKKENIFSWLLLMPFISLFFIFTLVPVASSVILSFFDYDIISPLKISGLQNYIRMFTGDKVFFKVLGTTLSFAVITGPLGFIISFLLAWFINEFSPLLRTILSFLFYAPALLGNAYFIWTVAFSGDSMGYVNNFLISFGFITQPINWFKDVRYNMTIIMIIQLWMSMGVAFLSNIAGLQNVNKELYEAGAIDGIKTRWHELWYITLPGMKSILLFGAIMQIQSVFSIGTLVSQMAGYPSVNNSVDTLVNLISDVGTMRYEMGYASALSVFLFLMMAVFRVIVGNFLNLLGNSD